MEAESSKKKTQKQQVADEPDSDSAAPQSTMERGAEVLSKTEKSVSDAYDKTAQTVSDTYEHAKSYGSNNPGKTLLIALGIGVGLGFVLSGALRHSRTGRIARPVVKAISDIATEFFG